MGTEWLVRYVLIILAVLLVSSTTAAAQTADAQLSDELVQLAQNQAAMTLGITLDRLTLAASMASWWPDSSLGCPQPGMAYSQIVTPGWLLDFDIDGGPDDIEVHTDAGSRAVVC